ncbi:MAG TPA: hypothetical protein VHY34_04240 [Caulobacteraceae bacterium]|jgi:hypothetical protein|nr:hypothetical protein [Caulobacteraceae bacterium]
MLRRLSILAALAALFVPSVSLANDDLLSGLWHVSGKIDNKYNVTVTCRLERHGEQLGGACLEGVNGKAHPLTAGNVEGDRVTWTHKGRFLLTTFNVVYSAVQDGDAMHGEVSAAGHSGAFTAAREL